jgi:ribosome-binding ATPase YchF (GTP1/OBG family)
LKDKELNGEDFPSWTDANMKEFAWALRDISKPTLIIANKMDLPSAADNFTRLQDQYSDMFIVPSSADAELTLRKAEQKKVITYVPGEERFEISENASLNEKQKAALSQIRSLLGQYMRTGVQFAINVTVFKLLRMNSIYPVSDISKLSDTGGAVLPDVFLMPAGSQVQDLAKEIHSDLARGLLYAVDARTGIHLPVDYELKDRDVLSIVSASRRRKTK